MDDPDIGNRTGLWFWKMIENLGLKTMRDAVIDTDYVEKIIFRFLIEIINEMDQADYS